MSSSEPNGGTPRQSRGTDVKKRGSREEEAALVDAKEAARLCSISTPMLYKLNAEGRMPMPVKLGTLLRWKRKEILGWIDEGCPTGKAKRSKK